MTKKIILFLTTVFVALPLGGAIISFVAPWEYDVSATTFLDWHRHIDYYMGKRGAFIGLPSLAFFVDSDNNLLERQGKNKGPIGVGYIVVKHHGYSHCNHWQCSYQSATTKSTSRSNSGKLGTD
ncbi:MAG: hypothetical protein LW841_06520 [Flammeovirgaceae bacterium]|jgi:hypothetical protein|nr:hypothetical protein [Flammeovirgaceae bacterium]